MPASPLPKIQSFGIPEMEEKVEGKKEKQERIKDEVKFALGPASWHSHPILPQVPMEGPL